MESVLAKAGAPIDARGDLVLVVKDVGFKVCSKTLRRACKEFRALLYGGFRESEQPESGNWAVALPDDNFYAMRALLHILHGNTHVVRKMKFPYPENMYYLVVVADKYNLMNRISEWVPRWVDQSGVFNEYQPSRENFGRFRNMIETYKPDWAWNMVYATHVAYELGNVKEFVEAVRHVCLEAEIYHDDSQGGDSRPSLGLMWRKNKKDRERFLDY